MTISLPKRRSRDDDGDEAASDIEIPDANATVVPARRRRIGRPSRRLLLATTFALLAAAAVTISFTGLPAREAQAIELLTAKVKRGDARTEVGGSGALAPATSIELSFGTTTQPSTGGSMSGSSSSTTSASVVRSVLVKRGQRVSRGQLLARLDQTNATLALQAAQRSYDAAVASRDEPTTTTQGGSTTQQRSDEDLALAVAEAEVSLRQAKDSLEATSIRAPRASIVDAVNIEVGSVPSSEAAAITLRSAGMQVVVDVSEDDIGSIKRGQQADVRIVALDMTIDGTVTAIDAEVTSSAASTAAAPSGGGGGSTSSVVTYPVAVRLDKLPAGVRTGMSAEVVIVTGSAKDVLVAPVTAITGSGANATARVPGDDGSIERVQVEVGLVTAQTAEIKSGLEEGDKVVTGIVAPEQEDEEEDSESGGLGGGALGGGGPPGGFAGGGGPPPGAFPGGGTGGPGSGGGNRG